MKKIKILGFTLDDTYTSEDIRNINAMLFIASMIMLVMMTIARIGGLA